MTAPSVQTHPSFSEVRRRKNKEPWRLWVDDQGRLFGRRTDPAFDATDLNPKAQPWFVQLPTQTFEDQDEEEVFFPEADDQLTVTNLNSVGKPKQRKALIQILQFPERIERGQKTTAVDVEVLKVEG